MGMTKSTNVLRCTAGWLQVFALAMVFIVAASTSRAQTPVDDDAPAQETIPVEFTLKRVGKVELLSIQRDNQVFLPLRKLFDFLKIRHEFDPTAGTLTGFLVSPDTPYVIDAQRSRIRVGKRAGDLSVSDYIVRDNDIFLRVELFERYFGLPVNYHPRQLAASLATTMALPVFLDQQLIKLENELARRPGPVEPEASVDRTFRLIDGARLDYVIRSSFSTTAVPNRSFLTHIAGHVLGGDVDARFTGTITPSPSLRQTRARWRFVPQHEREQGKLFRQITVGDFITSGLLSREIYGVEMTNHPPYPRIFFADETFSGSGFNERNIYFFDNFRIQQVARAETTGIYDITEMMRYGVNFVDIRQYSEWGERFGETYRIFIPTTFVPPKEVDYSVSAGRLRDFIYDPWYADAGFQWGISSRVTAGARVEYFDVDDLSTRVFPSVNALVRVTSHLTGEATLSPNALASGSLDLTLPSLVSGALTFTHYRKVRLFNPRNAINELTASLGLPFSAGGSRFSVDMGGTQTIFDQVRQRTARVGASAYFGSVSPRVSTRLGWNHSYVTRQTSLSFHETEPAVRFRLPANLFLSLSTRFDHIESEFIDARVDAILQPRTNLTFEFTYDRRFRFNDDFLRFRVQWILPYTRLNATVTSNGDRNTYYSLAVSGSIGVYPEGGRFFFENNAARANFGAILITPFLDENNSGIREPGEEVLTSAQVHASRLADAQGFTLTLFPELGWGTTRAVPYQHYVVEIDRTGFDNPLWVPRYNVVEVSTAPGRFTYYEMPVVLGGAIRGSVVIGDLPPNQFGVEGIRVHVKEVGTDARVPFEKTVETFSNGDYEILAVPPGTYEVSLDIRQLTMAKLATAQITRTVTLESKRDGEFCAD